MRTLWLAVCPEPFPQTLGDCLGQNMAVPRFVLNFTTREQILVGPGVGIELPFQNNPMVLAAVQLIQAINCRTRKELYWRYFDFTVRCPRPSKNNHVVYILWPPWPRLLLDSF